MSTQASPTVRRIVGPTILLQSGAYCDFEAPERSPYDVNDIAHALSNLCRFTGHVSRFYSIAEHSVHASRIVPPHWSYDALMHDAAEAFIGDVSKPLKDMLPDYRRIEARVERELAERFVLAYPIPEPVKEADIRMLATEQRQLMKNRDDWDYTRGREPVPIDLPCWPPDEARRQFLARYAELI